MIAFKKYGEVGESVGKPLSRLDITVPELDTPCCGVVHSIPISSSVVTYQLVSLQDRPCHSTSVQFLDQLNSIRKASRPEIIASEENVLNSSSPCAAASNANLAGNMREVGPMQDQFSIEF